MNALIVFDSQSDRTAIQDTAADLLNMRARVRLVTVDDLQTTSFDNMHYCVVTCAMNHLTDPVQEAYDQHTDDGMRTLSIPDLRRLLDFHDGHASTTLVPAK